MSEIHLPLLLHFTDFYHIFCGTLRTSAVSRTFVAKNMLTFLALINIAMSPESPRLVTVRTFFEVRHNSSSDFINKAIYDL
jgi:hypothetical protein